MINEEIYECKNCKKIVKVSDGKVPECCGEPMKKKVLQDVLICTQASHAESTRSMDEEEACDDGRAG